MVSEEHHMEPPNGNLDIPKTKEDKKARIILARRLNLSWQKCAQLAGCSTQAIRNWRREDPDFESACNFAKAELSVEQAAVLKTNTDPKVALQILERIDEDFQKPEKKITVTHVLDLKTLVPEEAKRIDFDLLDAQAKALRDAAKAAAEEGAEVVDLGPEDFEVND